MSVDPVFGNVKGGGFMKLGTIVAPTDFSESSLLAVETAFSLGLDRGATVYLLHVLRKRLERRARGREPDSPGPRKQSHLRDER